MKFKTINPLSYKGGRVERGTIIELPEEEAKAFDPADLAPYAGEESGAVEVEPATTGEGEQETDATETEQAVKPKAKTSRK